MVAAGPAASALTPQPVPGKQGSPAADPGPDLGDLLAADPVQPVHGGASAMARPRPRLKLQLADLPSPFEGGDKGQQAAQCYSVVAMTPEPTDTPPPRLPLSDEPRSADVSRCV